MELLLRSMGLKKPERKFGKLILHDIASDTEFNCPGHSMNSGLKTCSNIEQVSKRMQ